MSEGHLPGCRVILPQELLGPGEELPENVSPDLGIQRCEKGCPVLERKLVYARRIAQKIGRPVPKEER